MTVVESNGGGGCPVGVAAQSEWPIVCMQKTVNSLNREIVADRWGPVEVGSGPLVAICGCCACRRRLKSSGSRASDAAVDEAGFKVMKEVPSACPRSNSSRCGD